MNRTLKATANFSYDIRRLSIYNKNKIGGGVVELLLDEYRQSLKASKKIREIASEEDQKVIASMITDLEFAIKWIHTRQQPVPKKSRQVGFKDSQTFERIGSVDFFNPFAENPYVSVEETIDAERRSIQ